MNTKEALKPKVGLTKKDEKRKMKKDKLNQQLVAKEEAKAEMARQEQLEREMANRPPEVEENATMGSQFADLINQIQAQGHQKESDPRRANKKNNRTAIQNAKALISSAAFQSNPESAFNIINAHLDHKCMK